MALEHTVVSVHLNTQVIIIILVIFTIITVQSLLLAFFRSPVRTVDADDNRSTDMHIPNGDA